MMYECIRNLCGQKRSWDPEVHSGGQMCPTCRKRAVPTQNWPPMAQDFDELFEERAREHQAKLTAAEPNCPWTCRFHGKWDCGACHEERTRRYANCKPEDFYA